MSAPVRLGIVGCGGIAELGHAKAAAATDAVQIVACCDVVPEAAERFRDRHGCERAYTDYLAMIRDHDIDGVLFATWPGQHLEQVTRSLEAGVRNILCEKPLTLTGDDSYSLWRDVRSSGALLMEGFMYLHHPALGRVDELLADQSLGDVDHVRAAFSFFQPESSDAADRDWRERADVGGGVQYDISCYSVNACNHVVPSHPVRATGTTTLNQRSGTINRLYGMIEYANGAVGLVENSFASGFDQHLSIACTHAVVRLTPAFTIEGDPDLVVERTDRSGWGIAETSSIPVAGDDPYRLQFENFAAAVRGTAEPQVGLAESVVNGYTLDAILRSAAGGVAAPIELPSDLLSELKGDPR